MTVTNCTYVHTHILNGFVQNVYSCQYFLYQYLQDQADLLPNLRTQLVLVTAGHVDRKYLLLSHL